jgi:deoxyribose-phosphate aldolase
MSTTMKDLLATIDAYEHELPAMPPVLSLADHPINTFIDNAMHEPDATPRQVTDLCEEARRYQFHTVFVNPVNVNLVSRLLAGSGVHTGSVAGFPLGGFPTHLKIAEAQYGLDMGADEIDMVIHVGALKDGRYEEVLEDIQRVVETVHNGGGICKVIMENVLLNRREKIAGCVLAKAAHADFVKTSTGFSKGGATIEDIQLMRRVVGPDDVMGVKGAGGVRSFEIARQLIEAGASRLGTRLGAKIIEESRGAA